MANLSRRGFIAATVAAGALRAVPMIASKPAARRILTLVYDKKLGMMARHRPACAVTSPLALVGSLRSSLRS